MKRVLVTVVLACLFVVEAGTAALAAGPEITAPYAILMDSVTGDVLWEKNGYEAVPPASTTKIFTALVALELNMQDRVYTVSEAAAAVGESSAGLVVGERFTVENLLRGALVKSANDACYAIAEAAAGTEPLFVHWLEVKAGILGSVNVQFKNTNGLPDEEHLLSPYVLAAATREALAFDFFRETVASRSIVMEGGSYNRTFKNTNKLLGTDGVIGVKTGTTDAAGACLVSAMSRDGREVIAVVLKSADRYGDSLKLLAYGIEYFENLTWLAEGMRLGYYPVKGSHEGGVDVYAAGDGVVTVPVGQKAMWVEYCWREQEELPEIAAGEVLGEARLVDEEGTVISRVQLVSGGVITYPWVYQLKHRLQSDVAQFFS